MYLVSKMKRQHHLDLGSERQVKKPGELVYPAFWDTLGGDVIKSKKKYILKKAHRQALTACL